MLVTKNSVTQQSEVQTCQAAETAKLINLKITQNSSHLAKAQIEISNLATHPIYNEIIKLFKCRRIDGFLQKDIPLEYLEEIYNQEIKQKLKSYLFSHIVIDNLINGLIAQKIPFSNYPRLMNIKTSNENDISFMFDLSLTEPIELKEWKNFAFKSPNRKRYKDLDKQVKSFLETQTHSSLHPQAGQIQECDWVSFSALLLDENHKPIFQQLVSHFWIRMQKSEIANKFKSTFIGKKQGESFITDELNFEDPSDTLNCAEPIFLITIKSVVKGSSLSIDYFKHMFKLKNKTDIHNKMMEVFSYRNDVSQRKTIIEETFNLLLSKHRFEVPKHLVLRRQEDILLNLVTQPDYHVYKAQKDFLKCIELLAEKNLKEETIIDQIAYKENINVDNNDIQDYLNLLNNKRICEFAYFRPTLEKIDDLHSPLNQSAITHTALREKTLNYIIYNLTK
jgi:FKBP-type peptidyl-prolyl cis-trans isomerase (trigger factor)